MKRQGLCEPITAACISGGNVHMKKLVSSVLAASMVMSLAACGSTASTDSAADSSAASAASSAATTEAAGEGSGAYTGTPIKIGGIGPMFYFSRPGNGSLLHFVRPVFSGKALLKACTNGSSELMTNLSASLVGALYNWQLLRLGGADGVAAYGVIMYVSFIFAAIFIGYAQGCAPVVSYHYGADNTDELKNLLRISLRVIAVGGVAMLCFSELLAAPLSRFFVGYDAELLELTTLGMKLYSLSFLLCGFNIFGSAFFTALNNGIVSAVISFLRTLVFQVTAILVLPHLLGMNGIWLSVVAAEIAALFVNAFFLVKNRKKYQY